MILHMPVHKILDEMPHTEMLGWFKYLKIRPYGWRDDYRAYSIMSSVSMNGGKQKPEEVFESLRAVFNHEKSKAIKFKEGVMPKGEFLNKMLAATGGDSDFDFGKLTKGA